MSVFKKITKPIRKAAKAVDVTAKKSAIRGAGRSIDKKVGGKAGWMAGGAVVAGAALAVTGNVAMGSALAAKGLQAQAAIQGAKGARPAVAGDPRQNIASTAGAVAGDPRAGLARAPAVTTNAASSSAPASSPSWWQRVKAIFTPRRVA